VAVSCDPGPGHYTCGSLGSFRVAGVTAAKEWRVPPAFGLDARPDGCRVRAASY